RRDGRTEQEAAQLVPYPLAGDATEGVEGRRDGLPGLPLDPEAEHRRKTHGTKGTQSVLGETLVRPAHRPEPPTGEITHATEGIADITGQRVVGDGVDGEVAPAEILFDRVEELDAL